MGRSEGKHDEWIDWIQATPLEIRAKLAKTIRTANLETPQGLVKLTQTIMADVAHGNLPPMVSIELRDWCRLIHDQIVAASMVGGKEGNSFVGSVNLFMQEAIRTPTPRELPENLIDAAEISRSVQREQRKVRA